MFSPELYPPTSGGPFLLEAPRTPRPSLHEPEEPTPFAEVFQGKSIQAPEPDPRPDPVDDAPPAQDPLTERDSGADPEREALEQPIEPTDPPDAPPASSDTPPTADGDPEAFEKSTEATATVSVPSAIEHALQPDHPAGAHVPRSDSNAKQPPFSAQTAPTPVAPAPPGQAQVREQSHQATTAAQPGEPAPAAKDAQAPAVTQPDAQGIAKQAQTHIAPSQSEQAKPADQTNAEHQRVQSAPDASKPEYGASAQNKGDQQPQNNANKESSPDPRAQSVFKASHAENQSEPTYRTEPTADTRVAAPLAQQGEPSAAPKLAVQPTAQPQEQAQLSQEQIAKFRAGLVKGFNAVLRTSGGSLSMNLTPPTLGKVSIEMTVQEGRVNVQLSAANEQAHRLLNENLAMLRTTLESKGLKVDRLSVQVSTSSAQSQSASPAPTAQQNADSSQQDSNHDAGQGQSRGRSDNNDASSGGDRPDDPALGPDQIANDRGGASFAQRLELSLDAVG